MMPLARRVRVACVAVMLCAAVGLAAEPVPPAADVKLAVETLRDVFETDYAAAEKDAAAKATLARKLFEAAPKRKTPAMIFACYDEARRLSAAAGEVKLALESLAALETQFKGVPTATSLDTLKLLAESPLTAQQAVTVTQLASEAARRTLDREDYIGAVALGQVAVTAAKKTQDPDLALESRAFVASAEALAKAVETLKTKPDDPAANDRLATHLLATRGKLEPTLKYFAKGSDKLLAEVAGKDIANPKTAKERTAVGELWHKLAKDAPPERKRLMAERAWEWYTAAVAVATGDDDLKPGERAKEIEKAYPDLFDKTMEGHTAAAAAVAVTPDGKTLVSVGNDNSVRLWDAATGKLLNTLDGHSGWVGSLAVSPDGAKAFTGGGDNLIRVWDLKTGKQLDPLEGHTVAVRGLALSADGKLLASAGSDKTIRLWDVAGRKQLKKFGPETELIECVAITPDGGRVLAGSDKGVITVYDAKTGDVVSKFDKHADTIVYTITTTKDGKTALSGARDKEIRVWDVATGKQLKTLSGHTEQVYQIVLSPDEKQVLSASFDRTLRLWDLATGKELKKFEGHRDGVQGACYGTDGRTVYSAGWDKTIRKWRVPVGLVAGMPMKKID